MSGNVKNIIAILVFFLLQVIWFNQVQIMHRYIPIIYIYPLLRFPVTKEHNISYMIWAFLLGIAIDLTSNTGGVFAATAVFVVYMRKMFFLFSKSSIDNYEDIKIEKLSFSYRIVYYFIFIFLAQILIYFLESFNMSFLWNNISFIFINTLISLLFFIFIDLLFYHNRIG